MKKKICLNYESSINNIAEINTSVATGVLRVAYTNENQNGSYISKEAFERAIPTIYNKPIVGNFIREENDFGGHDMGVVKDQDGELRIVNFTTPIGVVPESASYFWEEIDGHEYLCVDVVIWKRQEGYRKLKEDGIISESMEIEVTEGYTEEDTDLFVIENFEFTAFCLLGSGVEPCFEEAALELYSADNMKSLIKQMMSEIKDTFYSVKTPDGDDNTEFLKKGGDEVLDEKIELAKKFNIDIESLDFSIEEMSIEELTAKFEELTSENPEPEATIPEEDKETFSEGSEVPEEEGENAENFSLNRNLTDEMINAFSEVKGNDPWGYEVNMYCFEDYDPEKGEAYAWDRTANWKLFGFSYVMDGDKVVIDFDSKKRKKYTIVDFEEGSPETISAIGNAFAEIESNLHDASEWESKYQEASDTITSMESEIAELKEFKASVEQNEANAEREELFSQFEDLIGDESFDALVENASEYDIETLEEKCYAIRGRKNSVNKFSAKKPKKILVPNEDNEKIPYGGIVEKYIGSR